MPHLVCIDSDRETSPACSENDCTAPLPRALLILVTDPGYALLCRALGAAPGPRADCIALAKHSNKETLYIVELKGVKKLRSEITQRDLLEKIRSKLIHSIDCAAKLAKNQALETTIVIAIPYTHLITLNRPAANKLIARLIATAQETACAKKDMKARIILADCIGTAILCNNL